MRRTRQAIPLLALFLFTMDVVGVERAHWSVGPFAAEIKDGFLHGRGAIDDKGMLAANLETMLLASLEFGTKLIYGAMARVTR
jgi:acetylornithine deacetylase/succinyl-diaminopimelate desuccinylase-like protein